MSRVALAKAPGVVSQLVLRKSALAPCAIVCQRWKSYKPDHLKKIHKREEARLDWADPLIKHKKQMNEGAEIQPEPHMLHAVWRVQEIKGRPYWERNICKELGLDVPMHRAVVLKNTPGINKKLMEVKHLLKIHPLTFPHGVPEHESDFEHTLLNCNGQFTVKKMLPQCAAVEEDEEESRSTKWDLSKETVKKVIMRKKENNMLHTEYHKTYYNYKLNQDGKEYRYNKHKNTPKYKY